MAQLAEVAQNLLAAAVAAPYLGREEEYALASRWKHEGDEEGMHLLARATMACRSPTSFRRGMSGCWRPRRVLILSAMCVFRPMRRGGFALQCKTTFYTIGRSSGAEPVRRKKPCFSISGGSAQSLRKGVAQPAI